MHLQIIFIVFTIFSALFCLTNEAPAGGTETGGSSSNTRKVKVPFSDEEKRFIRSQVSSHAQSETVTSWISLAKEHARKVKNRDLGFTHDRSAATIRKHFERFLQQDVPDWAAKSKSVANNRYSEQEEALINQELLNDSLRFNLLNDAIVWQTIFEKHNLKRKQKCEGFLHKRSATGLCAHFRLSMKPGNRVTQEVMERFPRNFRPSQESTSGSYQNSDEEIHPDHDTDPCENMTTTETGGSSSNTRKVKVPFSDEEKRFIRSQVSSHAQSKTVTSWTSLAKEHARKVKNRDLGFTHDRSAATIRKHFERFLQQDVPDWTAKSTSVAYNRYSEQEEAFINQELLNDSFRFNLLNDATVWQTIFEKHNLKRKQKCEGFLHKRSATGLCAHFRLSMKPGKRVTQEVMERFQRNFRPRQESTSGSYQNSDEEIHPDHDTDPCENMTTAQENSDDDSDVFGGIMRELEDPGRTVDESGIDHSLFVEKRSSRK